MSAPVFGKEYEFQFYVGWRYAEDNKRTGRGIVVGLAEWSPGYRLRVVSSEQYKAGEIITCSAHDLREVAS